tara:strand:- start:47 stop:202 length:156 start_codon:yes stop_codon:yes gene_type:complete
MHAHAVVASASHCRIGSSDLIRCIVVPGVLSGLESMYFHDVCERQEVRGKR